MSLPGVKELRDNTYKNAFHDCFNVYNILIDEEMQQYFKQVPFCVVYKL